MTVKTTSSKMRRQVHAVGLLLFCCSLMVAVPLVRAEATPDAEDILQARRELLQAVRNDGAAAAPGLVAALSHPSGLVSMTAAHLLVSLDPPSRQGLEALLAHPDDDVRRLGIRAVANLDWLPEYWAGVVRDQSPAIRRETRLLLVDEYIAPMEGDARLKVMDGFMEAYGDEEESVRMHVVEMLAELAEPREPGWDILRKATRDADESVSQRAFQVVIAPVLADMQSLLKERKRAELIEKYADEDISDWLDEDLAAQALALRGQAYYFLKNGEKARADLEQSHKLVASQRILEMLANNELNNCGNPARALEWHRALLDFRGKKYSRIMSRSYLRSANILREAQRYDEALAILNEAGPEDMTGSRAYSYYSAIGEILREQGRQDEALKTYRKALKIEGMSDRHKELLQAAIDAIVSP